MKQYNFISLVVAKTEIILFKHTNYRNANLLLELFVEIYATSFDIGYNFCFTEALL